MSNPRKVVVIDDSETVLEMTQEVLEAGGYSVVTVSSPALLPSTLNREKPDLVLVDVSMPFMGGQSVVELVRRTQLTHCPLVLFSDRPEEELKRVAVSCGADGYIRKTSDAKRLLQAISEHLSVRSSKSAIASRDVVVVTEQQTVRTALDAAVRAAGCVPIMRPADGALIESLVQRRPLAVLLDLDSGLMPGDASCRAIKEHADLRDLPVLLMTGNTSAMQVSRICRAGAVDALWLPVSADQVAAKIGALCTTTGTAESTTPPGINGQERAPFYALVHFRTPGSMNWLPALSCVFSMGNMFMRTLTPEHKETKLEIQVESGGQRHALSGKVAWVQLLNGNPSTPPGMGVRLAEVPPELGRQLGRALHVEPGLTPPGGTSLPPPPAAPSTAPPLTSGPRFTPPSRPANDSSSPALHPPHSPAHKEKP